VGEWKQADDEVKETRLLIKAPGFTTFQRDAAG